MTRRTIAVDSEIWKVYPTGRITVYGKDEFGLLFELGTGPERKRRFIRYSPLGSKSTDASLAELTERQLLDFFRQSQPAWTSPEGDVHAGCDWRKKSSSCRSVSSARDASVLLDPRGE